MGVRIFREYECDVCRRVRSINPENEPDPPKDWNVQGDFVICADCLRDPKEDPQES